MVLSIISGAFAATHLGLAAAGVGYHYYNYCYSYLLDQQRCLDLAKKHTVILYIKLVIMEFFFYLNKTNSVVVHYGGIIPLNGI